MCLDVGCQTIIMVKIPGFTKSLISDTWFSVKVPETRMVVLTGHQKQKNDLKGSQIIFPAAQKRPIFSSSFFPKRRKL